jgi:ribosomal protein S18 acetylase RimI-like enzyme
LNNQEIIATAQRGLAEVLKEITRRCGGIAREEDGLVMVAANHPCPVFVNSALRIGPVDANDTLRRIKAFFAERGHHCETWVREGADADLEQVAIAAGMRVAIELSGMVLHQCPDLPEPQTGVEIRRVENAQGVRDFADIAGDVFADEVSGLKDLVHHMFSEPRSLVAPDTAAFVVWDRGEPASTALTMVKEGVAQVCWVATRPEARGRGLGGLATVAATRAGFALGARFASLEASAMGAPVYQRLGFREVLRYRTYWSPEFTG